MAPLVLFAALLAVPQNAQNLPEEDEIVKPKEYAFNPLQANKEMRTGDFYLRRGKYNAAAARYTEATRWNPQSAEAFYKLGEAQEKQEDWKAARDAFQHAVDLEPNGKIAAEAKKRLGKLRQ